MSSRYGKIRTAEDLDLAIMNVKAEQKAAGTGIRKDFDHLLESLSPSNLVKKVIPPSTVTDAGLGIVQGLKKLLGGKPKKETQPEPAPEPCEE